MLNRLLSHGLLRSRWLAVLFVLSVHHFPTGVVGRLRLLAQKGRA